MGECLEKMREYDTYNEIGTSQFKSQLLFLSLYVIPEHEQLAGCRTLVLMLRSASIWDGMIKPNTACAVYSSSCGGQLSALRNSEIKAYTNLEGEGICLQSLKTGWASVIGFSNTFFS